MKLTEPLLCLIFLKYTDLELLLLLNLSETVQKNQETDLQLGFHHHFIWLTYSFF